MTAHPTSRTLLALLAALMPVGVPPASATGPREAAVGEIAATPAAFDTKAVVIEGLVVKEFENYGLYESYDVYCGREQGAALYVDWNAAKDVKDADTRRMARVEGTFQDQIGKAGPKGPAPVPTDAPGPGPLANVKIVAWLSKPMPKCK